MRLRHAIALLADSGVEALGPTIWADLGCGDGTFTIALASLVASGSTIHAIDRDRAALQRIPPAHNGVHIATHHGDFTHHPWPFDDLDGILMANSLHYIENQAAFIRACNKHMKSRRRFLIVEYDTNEANRWVPFPVSRSRLAAYRRAPLYAALIAPLTPQFP
jgi:ubiquinone/menaquinone biosynthesis C-methylase UbiE